MLIFIINNLFDLTNGSFKNLINTNLRECDCLKRQLHSYKNEEDMRKILEIIMNNEYYRQYDYSRSLESCL